jgi:hypothetical protein
MASAAKLVPPIDPLEELQKRFCLFKLAGSIWIGDRSEIAALQSGAHGHEVSMYRLADGKLLMQRALEAMPLASDSRRIVSEFMLSPTTIIYDAVAFSPLPTPPGTLNFWTGSPVIPVAGDWTPIKSFLLWVICDGDMGLYRYLIMFLAHMLQKPEEKPGIIMVLLGGQGTGKGTFFELLRAIWPRTTLQVSDVSNVIGQFNAGIERNFVICMDEALFAGDRRASDRLKSFITEPVVTIEQKYQPRRTIRSFHRFFASSNHAHFAQVDADDRRFVILQVSEARKGDAAYWSAIHASIADPAVISAMVHDLMNINLDHFNVRERPKTKGHVDQKLRSLTGFDRYWHEVLQTGDFGPSVLPEPKGAWSAPCFVSTMGLLEGWRHYEKGQRQFGARQERDVSSAMARLCPSAEKRRKKVHGGHPRGFDLPPLPVARSEFAQAIGGEVDWDA